MLLLPHVTESDTGMLATIIKGGVYEEISDAEGVDVDFRVILQVVPNADIVIRAFKTRQKPEGKTASKKVTTRKTKKSKDETTNEK